MNLNAIIHRTAVPDCYPLNHDTLVLNIRTGKDVTGVTVIHEDPYAYGISGDIHWVGNPTPMTLLRELKQCLIWTVTIRPEHKRLQYYFELYCGNEKMLMLEDGFYTEAELEKPGRFKQYFKFAYLNSADVITPPSWVEDTIWYQIMPDRFCRGDMRSKRMKLKDWNSPEPVRPNDFYGGDLRGIIQKLPYLAELGISGIYLLPVFLSDSNHKYNTIDYEQIDPDFGTEDDMKELVNTAHSLGIRVMLDAVFNHSGTGFFAWQDVWENGENSRYFDWFCINKVPLPRIRASLRDGRFHGFAFLDGMPKLNTNNPEVTAYCIDRCKYWVEKWHIDGIRFDVGNEVSHTFLKEANRILKACNPELFLLGEIWMDSIMWLLGDEYDSVMNYPLMESMQNFWVDKNAPSQELMYVLERCYSLYPEQVNRVIFNFLDTHDTMRARTRWEDPDIFYQQLAILMTVPGTACIYYGTEIAMPGGHDPDCRRTMPWDEIQSGIHNASMEEVKNLLSVRKRHSQAKGTEIRWHHDPKQPRFVCYDRPGEKHDLRIYLNAGSDAVLLPSDNPPVYSRKYQDGSLLSGGILIQEIPTE